MNLKLASDADVAFFQEYTKKLEKLQDLIGDGLTVYTKITVSYALLNDLQIMNLLFHPKSIGFSKDDKIPEYSFKKTIEEIIQYELTSDDIKLSSKELKRVIEHFRQLEKN